MIEKKIPFLLFITLSFTYISGLSQGSICTESTPFCSISGIEFPNCNSNDPNCNSFAENGPDYGCLVSTPFPAWYFLQIENPGSIELTIRQTTGPDLTGSGLDVDFICWGPFPDTISPCTSELTAANTVDCSFLPDPIERFTIPNAQSGDFYILLITNFSRRPGFINFAQTGGGGSTDCDILEIVLGPDQNICGPGSVELNAENENAISYEWSIFNESTSAFEILIGETNPTLTVANTGRYMVSVEGMDETETDEIEIQFLTPPIITNNPINLTECDSNNGTANFDFSDNTNLIIGSQDRSLFSVSYYLSLNDAETGINSVGTNFISESREIFARIQRTDLSDCFETTSFLIEVSPRPILNSSSFEHFFCEVSDASENESEIQNIENFINELTNSNGETIALLSNTEPLDISNFTLSYHRSPNEVIANTNPIQNGDPIQNGEIIYIRIQNNTPPFCLNNNNIASIKINFGQIPIVNTTIPNLIECATNAQNENISTFNLRNNDTNINSILNNTSTKVNYYLSELNFQNNIPIPEDEVQNFINTTSPQKIYASVENTITNCQTTELINFDLITLPLPTLPEDRFFSGIRKVCVFSNGNLQTPFIIGEDIGAIDGEEYIYDWTPDNIDSNGDGNEDAFFFISNISQETTFELTITRRNFLNLGIDCSNNIDPNTREEYRVTIIPTGAPTSLDYTINENAFSGIYTINAIVNLPFGNLEDIEYKLGNSDFQDSPTFRNISPGSFMLTARNKLNCIPTIVSTEVEILDFPRFFTPNNDGINDVWNLISTQIPETAEIYIFNRYGKVLTKIFSGSNGWDGTYNSQILPADSYWFTVNYNEIDTGEPKSFSSSFLLKR